MWWIGMLGLLMGCQEEPFIPPASTRSEAGTLAEDDFLLGINYPWLNYGLDFGSSDWGDYGVSGYSTAVGSDLAAIAQARGEVVRWFVLADGRAGVVFDEEGTPTGLQDGVLGDLDTALDQAQASGVRLVPVLLDFYWLSAPEVLDGVQMGGHADVIRDPTKRAALLSEVIEPLLLAAGDHRAVLAWDVINEPEWAMGWGSSWLGDGVEPDEMQAFVMDCTDAIHALTEHDATLGSADRLGLEAYWLDVGLDLLQYHYYEDTLFHHSAASLDTDLPVVIGEFPTDTDSPGIADTLDAIAGSGFAGAWPWSLNGEDTASDLDLGVLESWQQTR